jgi:hypothetical protein
MATKKSESSAKKSSPSNTKNEPVISKEEISIRAKNIFLERQKKGIHGTSDQDWYQALTELKKEKSK